MVPIPTNEHRLQRTPRFSRCPSSAELRSALVYLRPSPLHHLRRRFLADRTDRASFLKQVHYFNRSLAQVTAAGECPELYFLKHGRYIANVHTPLAWTQANQALALYLMEKSIGENG